LFGKLTEITDSGIPVHYFIGNHDMWMRDYFEKEMNIIIHRQPIIKKYNNIKFFIGHGDGLGPGDYGYKFLKIIFRNSVCKWLFSLLHPQFAIWLANSMSGLSRMTHIEKEKIFLGEDKERLILYAKKKLTEEHFDYFILGHRHLPLDIKISDNCRYINVGDWIRNFSYVEFDGNKLELKNWKMEVRS
jgi:UDP-2,3-diacylglucosamine hydrolase